MLFSKSPVKDISQKIKPPQASIKNLKIERKKDFDSFLTYIKREAKTLDDIKLPKISEVKRKPFPIIGALLGLGFLGAGGLLSGLGSGDGESDGSTSKDSNFKLPSLSLASMKAYSGKGKGKGKKKKGDGDKPPSGVTDGTGAKKVVRETRYQQNRLQKIRNRVLNIKKKRYTTRIKGAIELKGEALLRQQKLEDRMTKAYNRNRKQFPVELTRKEKEAFRLFREENRQKKLIRIMANLMDSPAYAEADAEFNKIMGNRAVKNKELVEEEVSVTTGAGGKKIKKRGAPKIRLKSGERVLVTGTVGATDIDSFINAEDPFNPNKKTKVSQVPITSSGGPSEGFGGAPVTSGTGGSKSKGTGSTKISFGSDTPLATPENIKAELELKKFIRDDFKRKNKENQTNRMSKAYEKNRFRFPKKTGGGGFPYSTFRISDEGRNFKKTFMDFYKVKNNTLRVLSFMSGLMGGSPKLTFIRMLVETSINDLLYNPVADGTLEGNIEMMEVNRAEQINSLSSLIMSGEIDSPLGDGIPENSADTFITPPSYQLPAGGSAPSFDSRIFSAQDEDERLAEELIKYRLGER